VSDDLLVVGGGIEGYVAALVAATESPSLQVRLITPPESRFRRESGLIDVLGYVPGREGPVVDPFGSVGALSSTHPYQLLGTEWLRDALEWFDVTTGEAYCGGETDANALIGTCMGYPKPTSRYPAGTAPGVLSETDEMFLIGFERLTDFDAYFAGDNLAQYVDFGTSGVQIAFPRSISANPPSLRMARALDENEPCDDGTAVREALIDDVRRYLDIEPRVGFPAVLGRRAHEAVRDELRSKLHARVFEVPLGAPSVPGLRLEALLAGAAQEAGVTVETGTPVGHESSGDRVGSVRVQTDGDPTSYEATEFVLATGGLDEGGLRGNRSSVIEPVFDCRVEHSESRDEWADTDPLGDQPFARFGVAVDERLRPASRGGSKRYENLCVVGTALAGGNFVAEQSTGGVALATGFAGGTFAAERLR
jgi:glycerol-3-phosphate dehydrogenase subunit B